MKRLAVSALLAIAVLTSSCSGDDSGGSTTTAGYVPADPNDTDDPSKFAYTPTIKITPTGYVPLQAVAVFGQTVTFVNETADTQTISFTNGGLGVAGEIVEVGPIAPGESMAVSKPLTTAISLVFESDALPGQQGRLQVDPGVDSL